MAAAIFAVVSVVTPLGAAIGRSLDNFSAWISGSPGTPASPKDQQAFEQEKERGWTDFPTGTQLRQLLQTEAAGMTFTLFGYRNGDLLCLRLVASGYEGATGSSCAPVSALRQVIKEPALVMEADAGGFGSASTKPGPNGYLPEKASATYGIASDGVKDVILSADDGEHHALLGSNSFLYVADHPASGTRVRSIKAIAADGSTVALPFRTAPFGTNDGVATDVPSGRAVTGPKGIDHPPIQFPYDFPDLPFGIDRGIGTNQFVDLSGAASDEVYAIDLYLSDGTIQKLAVKKDPVRNTFVATPITLSQFPVRAVARDKQGAIIGNQVIPSPQERGTSEEFLR
jgi:hypothetical protein